jgi:adenosylmethionine-8-amino-7-oxononanoate aminotransferase
LQRELANSPVIGEVRGRGLMVCTEFVEPDGSGKPLDKAKVATLDQLAWERGAIVYARHHVLRLAPPLCITAKEVDQLVAMVADSIRAMEKTIRR